MVRIDHPDLSVCLSARSLPGAVHPVDDVPNDVPCRHNDVALDMPATSAEITTRAQDMVGFPNNHLMACRRRNRERSEPNDTCWTPHPPCSERWGRAVQWRLRHAPGHSAIEGAVSTALLS